MLKAVMYETQMAVKISGKTMDEFSEDLQYLKNVIPPFDRKYDDANKVFIINNPNRYQRIPFVRRAIEDRERQLTLF